MMNEYFTPEFMDSLVAKGINAPQFIRKICALVEQELTMSGNVNDFSSYNDSKVINIQIDLRYAPVSEIVLAKKVGLSRHTLKDWRIKGLLNGTFYTYKSFFHFYHLYPALKAIKLALLDSQRSELTEQEIFDDIV